MSDARCERPSVCHRTVLMGVALAFLAGHHSVDAADAVTVEPAVASAVAGLSLPTAGKPLKHVEYRSTLSPSVAATSGASWFENIGPNLWGVTTLRTTEHGVTQIRTVSLCGLVELVSASTSTMHLETSVSVPVMGFFIPFGMKVDKTFELSAHATSLVIELGSADLCAPMAGTSFSYVVRTETELPNAPAGRPKRLNTSFAWQCTVTSPADGDDRRLGRSSGSLLASCTSKNAVTGAPIAATYAYLPESGIYLKLESASDAFHVDITYTAVDN